MSRIDLVRSLLREAARRGADRLGASELVTRLDRSLTAAARGLLAVDDADMSAAVARIRGVAAATVTSELGAVCVDAALDDGGSLCVRLVPHAVKFAPAGAKEISFRADPPTALDHALARDAFAVIAEAIARTLWRPVLRGAPRSDPSAFVTRDGDVLVLDLRTVPAVRTALRTPASSVLIDALVLRAIDARPGGLALRVGLPGFGRR